MNRLLLLVLGLLCAGTISLAASCASTTTSPQIPYRIATDKIGSQLDWVSGQLEVVGIGLTGNVASPSARLDAQTTAMTMLMREARRAIADMRIDAQTCVADAYNNADVKRAVADQLANLQIVDEQYDEKTGRFAVVGVLPLLGQQGLTTLGVLAMPPAKSLEFTTKQITITTPMPRGHTPQHFDAPYTGIIVDSDQALISPCLLPHVLRFDGKELWGPAQLKPIDIMNGAVRYAASVEDAIARQLAGERPLVITAIGNAANYYPVVNLDDVYMTLTEQKSHRIMERLPWVITLGK